MVFFWHTPFIKIPIFLHHSLQRFYPSPAYLSPLPSVPVKLAFSSNGTASASSDAFVISGASTNSMIKEQEN